MFIELRNITKSFFQHLTTFFIFLLDGGIAKMCKKLNSQDDFGGEIKKGQKSASGWAGLAVLSSR